MVLTERLESPNAFRVGTSAGFKPKYSESGVLDATIKAVAGNDGPPDVKGPPYDLWGCNVFAVMEYISPAYSIDSVFNYPDDWDGQVYRRHQGYKPVQHDQRVPSASQASGSIIRTSLKLLTGQWNFSSGRVDEGANENPVFHTNYYGRCYSHVPESAWHRTPTRSAPYGTPILQVVPSYDGENGLLRLDPYPRTTWGWSYGYSPPEFWGHTSGFTGTWSPFEAVIYYGSKNTYHYMTFERDQSDPLQRITRIRYSYTNWYHPGGAVEYEATYDVEVIPMFEVKPFTLVMGQPFWLNQVIWSGVRFIYTFRSSRRKDNNQPSPHWEAWDSGYQSIDFRSTPWHTWMVHDFTPQSGFDVVKTMTVSEPTPSQDAWSLIRDYSSLVKPKLPDMWASTFYAAEDAYQTFMDAIETNNLENLSELQSISEFIEPVQGFASLFRAVRKRDPVQALLSILDILASAKLTWEYGIAPTIDDADEISSRAKVVLDRVSSGDFFKPQTFNGKFIYEVPDSYIPGLDGLRIISRAKVRGNLNPHSFLAALLPLRAFGLMPSLANLWDLLPFSFVVDWFTNIGRRMDDIDSSIQMLCLETNYVTLSMQVFWPIPQTHLDVGGVMPFTLETVDYPQVGTYIRTVQKDIPVLSYSTLDFRPAGGIPDLGTALSLVFKLIK